MNKPTRREALQAGAAGGAALWLASGPQSALAATGDGPVDRDGPHLRRSTYTGLVGSEFGADGLPLRLEAVSDIVGAAQRGLAGSDIAFALLFSGAGTLRQGVHTFTFPDGARAELFLVPVGAPGDVQLYEVSVDRSVRIAWADVPGAASTAAPAATAAPATAAAHTVAPDPRYAFLKSVSVRRARPGLQVRLSFAKGSGIRRVRVWVTRNGVTYARGRASAKNRRALAGLRLLGRLPRGRYEVLVEGTDGKARKTTVRRSVTIR